MSRCLIDCDSCTVRGDACADCVVSVMLGGPPPELAAEEERALDVLAKGGLVPGLRMTVLPRAVGDEHTPAAPGARPWVTGRSRSKW